MPILKKKKKSQQFDEAILKQLSSKIEDDRERDFRETAKYRDKLKLYLEQLMGDVEHKKKHETWESTLSLPVMWTEADLIATRIEQAVAETAQIVTMMPTSAEDVERTKIKESWFNWLLRNYIVGFSELIDRSVSTTVRLGMSILYSYYERKIRRIVHKRRFKVLEEDIADDQSFSDRCLKIIDQVFGDNKISVDSIGEFKYRIKYKRKTPVDSILDVMEDTAVFDCYYLENDKVLEIVVEENSIEYDGVRSQQIAIDNVWFPSTVRNNDELQTCNHVCIQFETNYTDIILKQKDKVYDLITDEELEIFQKATKTIADDYEQRNRIAIQENIGIEESGETDQNKVINFYECFYHYDINGDGIDEDIIITYFPEQRKIARIRRLNEIFRHGERPIDITGYAIREDSIFSVGICELLSQIQNEINILHNQFINYNTSATIPFGFARKDSSFGSSLEKKELVLKPMTLFFVDDPNDIKFPYVPSNQNWNIQDINILQTQAQDAIGSNDLMRGRQQYSRTPVGATLKLLAEANIRVKQGLKRYNRAFKEHLKKIYQLQRDYGAEKQTFRIIGEDGKFMFEEISREDLKILPDFELGTSIDNLNKVFMQEKLMMLVQTMVTPTLMQMGIMQPHNVYALLEKLLWTYDIKDYQKIMTKPPINELIPQKEENIKMMQGEYVDVNPLDDHVVHYHELKDFIDSSRFGLVDAEYIPYFTSHLQKHLLAIQQIQARQQQEQQQQEQSQAGIPKPNMETQRPKVNPMMPPGGTPSLNPQAQINQ